MLFANRFNLEFMIANILNGDNIIVIGKLNAFNYFAKDMGLNNQVNPKLLLEL
jgi:hypothetical protein